MAETFIPFDPKKVPAGVIITGGTTSKTKQYQGTALVDVVVTDPTLADRNKLLQDFEGFTADYRKALAQKLKAAGYYRGDVTGKPTLKLQDAYFNAYEDLNAYTRERFTALPAAAQQTTPIDNLESFLSKQTADDGSGGAEKITKIQQQIKLSPDIQRTFRSKWLSQRTLLRLSTRVWVVAYSARSQLKQHLIQRHFLSKKYLRVILLRQVALWDSMKYSTSFLGGDNG